MVRSIQKTIGHDSNDGIRKVRCLTKLIAELASEDCPVDYSTFLDEYEPLLHLYLIESRGSRKILRFGESREFVLTNYDFYHDLPAQEWMYYMCGRKIACLKILDELLATMLAE